MIERYVNQPDYYRDIISGKTHRNKFKVGDFLCFCPKTFRYIKAHKKTELTLKQIVDRDNIVIQIC